MISHFSHVQLFSTLWIIYSLSGSSVHGILQARILEWVAMPSSRVYSWPMYQTHVSYIFCIGRQVLYEYHHMGSPRLYDVLSIFQGSMMLFQHDVISIFLKLGWLEGKTEGYLKFAREKKKSPFDYEGRNRNSRSGSLLVASVRPLGQLSSHYPWYYCWASIK